MQKLAVQSALPANPDVAGGLTGSPPFIVLLTVCREIQVVLHATTAPVTVRPYWWHASLGAWVGIGADGLAPLQAMTADPNQFGGVAEARYSAPAQSAYWCLLAESGVNTNVDSAYIGEIANKLA